MRGGFVVDQPEAVGARDSGLVAGEKEAVHADGEVVRLRGGDGELACGGGGAGLDEPQTDGVGEQFCQSGVDVAGKAVELVGGDASGAEEGGGTRAGGGKLREEIGVRCGRRRAGG